MDLLLLSARLLLAAVFLVAGAAKLADRAGSQKAVHEFGLPDPLARPLGTLLPIAEIVVAAALVPVATAWWGAVGALGLLMAFVAGIGFNMARGRAPECHCFGQLHSSPAGWNTLLRNLGLAAVALLVLVAGRVDAGADIVGVLAGLAQAQRAALIVATVVVLLAIANAWVLLRILQQQGRLVRRIRLLEAQFLSGSGLQLAEGLAAGTTAPAFMLPDLDGRQVALSDLLAGGRALLLAFVDPDCGPCRALMPRLAEWAEEHAGRFRTVGISRGSVEENRAMLGTGDLGDILLQRRREVDELYHVEATPSAVLVRPDGTIGSPHAGGADQIESLVAGLTGQLGETPFAPATSDHAHPHDATAGHDPDSAHGGLESASA